MRILRRCVFLKVRCVPYRCLHFVLNLAYSENLDIVVNKNTISTKKAKVPANIVELCEEFNNLLIYTYSIIDFINNTMFHSLETSQTRSSIE